MSYTKRQYIEAALEEIGMAAYTFDLQPEQIESGVRRLDTLFAEWNGRGIKLSYPLPSTPENSNIDDETSVPDFANEAVITNLALKLAPSYGKNVSALTMSNARTALETVIAKTLEVPTMQYPSSMPRGMGNKSWRGDIFMPEPSSNDVTPPEYEVNFK